MRTTTNSNQSTTVRYSTGIGLGTLIAVVISWTVNKSVLWCIIHGIFGWWYVLYYLIFC